MGHDGMEMWWPKQRQPFCFRGFHIQEILDVAITYGLMLMPIEPYPVSNGRVVNLGEDRFENYMKMYPGIVVGESHAVAWDTQKYFDPKYGLDVNIIDFSIRELWAVTKCTSCNLPPLLQSKTK